MLFAYLVIAVIIIGILGIISIPFIRFYNLQVVPARNENKQRQLSNYAIFEPSSSVLILKQRHSGLSGAFKIKDDHNYTMSYKPETYVYTGATVGGITTGGVHKEGGYNYISGSSKNGKCNLYYCGNIIRTIKLTDELFELAKKSEIKKYLSKNKEKEIIIIEPAGFSSVTEAFAISGNANMYFNSAMRDISKGSPTQEKCIQILNWICCVEETVNQ